jgi:hypothetical protein
MVLRPISRDQVRPRLWAWPPVPVRAHVMDGSETIVATSARPFSVPRRHRETAISDGRSGFNNLRSTSTRSPRPAETIVDPQAMNVLPCSRHQTC